jgi:hypothetical protein
MVGLCVTPIDVVRTLYRGNRILTLTGWFHWLLAAVLLLIYPFDSRTILD